jgi:glycosyltransferase involved in cell wall biosynthesis
LMTALDRLAGRRILFLNWRDLANPAAGGAESYTEQMGRRFANAGALVTLFTSRYRDAPPYAWANGYLVVREGGRFGVYLAAARHLRRHGHLYDAVVDFQNGIRFFAPLQIPDKPVVCVVHHVHQAQFDMYFRWPLNRIARLLEGRVSRIVYGDRPLVAVSPSARAEMRRKLGFRGPIFIVPNGLNPLPASHVLRSPTPAIAVVTRLVPHKRLHLLVEAVPDLLGRWPDLRVDIAGTGPARDALLAQVREFGLERVVALPGRVSEQRKSDLLRRAWLTVTPSLAEGWRLTVMEANAAGTPAVSFDVPGLRDSVRDGETGWLLAPGRSLADALADALEELANPERRQFITERCRQWASRFSWDASAERLANVVLSEVARKAQGSPSRRGADQLATIAWWPPGDAVEVRQALGKALRATDVITSDKSGLSAMLMGCDELGAITALQRATIQPARLRLATTAEILCGTGEDKQSDQ